MGRHRRRHAVIFAVLAMMTPGPIWAEPQHAAWFDSITGPSQLGTTIDNAVAVDASERREASGSLFRNGVTFANEPLNLGPIAIKLATATAFVLGITVLTLLVLRRHLARRGGFAKGSQAMSIEATLPLAHRSCLQVIRLDEHRLVVGCDAGGLRTVLLLPESFTQAMASVPEQDALASPKDDWTMQADSRSRDWEVTKWKPQRPIM